MLEPSANEKHDRRALALKAALLVVMFVVSFGVCFFARQLSFTVMGWPVHFWIAAQGGVLVFIGIVTLYAWLMNRMEAREAREKEGEGSGG